MIRMVFVNWTHDVVLLIFDTQFQKLAVGRSRVFYIYSYEGYGSKTPLDATSVNRTILLAQSVHNHSAY